MAIASGLLVVLRRSAGFLTLSSDWTKVGWFKVDDVPSLGRFHIYRTMGPSDPTYSDPYAGIFDEYASGALDLYVEGRNIAADDQFAPSTAVLPATWRHLAYRYEASTTTLSVVLNGVQVASVVVDFSATPTPPWEYLGGIPGDTEAMGGMAMAYVGDWQRWLSDAEILAQLPSPVPVVTTHLLQWDTLAHPSALGSWSLYDGDLGFMSAGPIQTRYGLVDCGEASFVQPCAPAQAPSPPPCLPPTITAVREGGIVIPHSTPAPIEDCPGAILCPTTATYLRRTSRLPSNTADWTIMCWFKNAVAGLATNDTDYKTGLALFTGGHEDFSTLSVWLGAYRHGGVQVVTLESAAADSDFVPLPVDAWGHLAATYRAASHVLSFYMNAALQPTTLTQDLSALPFSSAVLGGDVAGTASANVGLAYVRCFQAVLTATQIAAERLSRRPVLPSVRLESSLERLTDLGGWTSHGAPSAMDGPVFAQPTIGGIQ